jgi:hypothetical protein
MMFVAPIAPARADVSFFDGTFDPADWTIQSAAQVGNGGTTSATQQQTGGDPDQFRQISQTVNPIPEAGGSSTTYNFHLNLTATYDPANGAIESIDYSEDAILISGFGDGQALGPAILQGGQIYIRANQVSPDFAWTDKDFPGLGEGSFALFGDGTQHPDFSEQGDPIQFGFVRANSTLGNGYTIIGGIDNWSYTIHTTENGGGNNGGNGGTDNGGGNNGGAPVIPVPAAAWMALSTLCGAGAAGWIKGKLFRK